MRLLLFNLATDARDPVLGFTLRWLEAFSQYAEHIDVITMRAGEYTLPQNVRVYSVGKEQGYSEPRRVFEFYRILFRLLWAERYDGCFAHMMPVFAVMAAPFLFFRGIPLVLWYAHKSVTPILRVATLLVGRIVTPSRRSFRIKSKKVRVTGHGIDTETFSPSKTKPPRSKVLTLVTVGRLSPIKHVEVFIEAIALFKEMRPEIPLCVRIIGGAASPQDHAYVAQLKQQVEQLQLQQIVTFSGSVPFEQLVPWYQQADCFVNVSETGSVDKAALEAMSCGVAVILPQTFSDVLGETLARTWVVETDAQAVAERLQTLVCLSETDRQQLGDELRAIVIENHDLQKLCVRILDELQLLRRGKGPA